MCKKMTDPEKTDEENNELDEIDREEQSEKKSKNKRKPTLGPDSPPSEFIQYMLTAIGFYDYLFNRPFDMIFQDKSYMNYDVQIIEPLLSYSDSFKKVHEEFKIDELLSKLREAGKTRANEGGFNASIQKQGKKYTLPLYIGSIAGMGIVLVLSFLGILPAGVEWYIMVPVMLAACIGPMLVNYLLQKKWLKFIEENMQAFLSEQVNEINKGIDFIQQIINDAHDLMIENELDGRRFRLMCFRKDYQNLNILEERSQRGINFFVAEFITPNFEDLGKSTAENTQEEKDIDDDNEKAEDIKENTENKEDKWEIKED